MRKILAYLLASLMVISLMACGKQAVSSHNLRYEKAECMDLFFNDESLHCVCVYTEFTNTTDNSVLPADETTVKAYQNGIELSPWVFTGERTNNYVQCDTSIQSGATAKVIWIFEIRDDNEITIEFPNNKDIEKVIIDSDAEANNETFNSTEPLKELYDANMITEDELKEYIQEVEATVDNWTDFYEIIEEENMETDAFGDLTGNKEYRNYYKPREEYSFSEDYAIKINYDIIEWDCYYDSEEDLKNFKPNYEPRNRDDVFEGYSTIDISHIRKMYMSTNVEGEKNYYYVREHDNLTALKVQGNVTKIYIPQNKINVNSEGLSYYVVSISDGNEYVYYLETDTVHTYKNGKLINGSSYDENDFWCMLYEKIK